MLWDPVIEAHAQAWADACNYTHSTQGQRSNIGGCVLCPLPPLRLPRQLSLANEVNNVGLVQTLQFLWLPFRLQLCGAKLGGWIGGLVEWHEGVDHVERRERQCVHVCWRACIHMEGLLTK